MDETNYFGNYESDSRKIDRIFSNVSSVVRNTKDIVHDVFDDRDTIPPYRGDSYYYDGPSRDEYNTRVRYAWGDEYDSRFASGNASVNTYPGISNPRYGMSIIKNNGGGRY